MESPLRIEQAIRDHKPGFVIPKLSIPDVEEERRFLEDREARNRKITCYALEGVHGVGKTTLCDLLEQYGYHVIREHFMNTFSNFIKEGNDKHNCLVETAWASMQILNIVNMANDIRREIFLYPEEADFFFVDRTFLTGIAYGVMSREMNYYYRTLFDDAIEALKNEYNIELKIVRLMPEDPEEHFQRILRRITVNVKEGDTRTSLHEADRSHFDKISAEYQKFSQYFDYTWFPKYYSRDNGRIVYIFIDEFLDTIGRLDEDKEDFERVMVFDTLTKTIICCLNKEEFLSQWENDQIDRME